MNLNANRRQALLIDIETQAKQIIGERKLIPAAEQSEWMKQKLFDCVKHLVGEERVLVAYYLGMHVGCELAADFTAGVSQSMKRSAL